MPSPAGRVQGDILPQLGLLLGRCAVEPCHVELGKSGAWPGSVCSFADGLAHHAAARVEAGQFFAVCWFGTADVQEKYKESLINDSYHFPGHFPGSPTRMFGCFPAVALCAPPGVWSSADIALPSKRQE